MGTALAVDLAESYKVEMGFRRVWVVYIHSLGCTGYKYS